MLPFHSAIADGLLRTNAGLAVLGRGLGVHQPLLELARRAIEDGGSDGKHATRLILVVNTPHDEAELLLRQAVGEGGSGWGPRWPASARERLIAVGPEMSVEDRAEAFTAGGVFFVSARLLVPDLLSGRLVPEAIDGFLINHAHSVGELSAEAFVLRIYRTKNKRGFLRALSDRPDLFVRASVEKVMQRCFLQNLDVWPRIRSEVQSSLHPDTSPDVVQKTLELPPSVHSIQRRILNIIDNTLDELKKDPQLPLGHLGVRDSVFQTFEAELRQALDPKWQTLGPRTRRMVQDLGAVRRLLGSLLRCDAVEFHALFEAACTAEGGRELPAWLFGPDAQALQELIRSRVYEVAANPGEPRQLHRTIQPHAKWEVLLDIIERTVEQVATMMAAPGGCSGTSAVSAGSMPAAAAPGHASAAPAETESDSDLEIVAVATPAKRPRLAGNSPASASKAADSLVEPRLVVIVPDDQTKRQISSVLHRGPEATLLDALFSYLRNRSGRPARAGQQQQQQQGNPPPGVPRACPLGGARPQRSADAALLAQEADIVARELQELAPRSALQLRRLADGRACHPRVDIVEADGASGSIEACLAEVSPHTVVMLEPSLEAIRAVEVFCARSPAGVKVEPGCKGNGYRTAGRLALRVHLLVFEDSIEKYKFHQALKEESSAIDHLIRARKHLTIKVDGGLVPTDAKGNAMVPRSTRRGGGSVLDASIKPTVVVDMREFRSALPFMLYLRELTVEPVTIPVGDYVLSRDVCVERKAIPDLVQSLASGRLYQQAQNMCQHYANPMLLIEFDPSKSFALLNTYTIAKREVDVGAKDILGKLALLVLHFPRMHLMWSPSQRFTADVFIKLKEGRYQPDAKAAAQIVDEDDDGQEGAAPAASVARAGGKSKPKAPRTNSAALEVLRKLPGVTPKNVYALARRGGSLAGVAALDEEALADTLGPASGKQLYDFLHKEVSSSSTPHQDAEAAPPAATAAQGRPQEVNAAAPGPPRVAPEGVAQPTSGA